VEKRKIQKEEGLKAQRALASMELSSNNEFEAKSADVDYLVSDQKLRSHAKLT
jgi:hypothetical protein